MSFDMVVVIDENIRNLTGKLGTDVDSHHGIDRACGRYRFLDGTELHWPCIKFPMVGIPTPYSGPDGDHDAKNNHPGKQDLHELQSTSSIAIEQSKT